MKVMQNRPEMLFQLKSKPNSIFESFHNFSDTNFPPHIFKQHSTKITKKEYNLIPSYLLDELDSDQIDEPFFESFPSSPIVDLLMHPLFQMETNEILNKIQTHQGVITHYSFIHIHISRLIHFHYQIQLLLLLKNQICYITTKIYFHY